MAAALQPAHSTPFTHETTRLIHSCDAPVSAPPSQHCAPALCRSKATISTDVTVGKGRQARCGVVPVARAPVKIRLVDLARRTATTSMPCRTRISVACAALDVPPATFE
jgi:hypothetical protein